MRQLSKDEVKELKIGDNVKLTSCNLPYSNAIYNGTVIQVLPRFVVFDVVAVANTLPQGSRFGDPLHYNYSIEYANVGIGDNVFAA